VAAFIAREARLLSALNPAEEGLIRLVQSRQHVLQHMTMAGGVLPELGADRLQLRFLLESGDGDAAALPGDNALLQGDVVETTAEQQDALQRSLLRRSRSSISSPCCLPPCLPSEVMLDRLLAHMARRAGKIRTCPGRRELEQVRELLAQM